MKRMFLFGLFVVMAMPAWSQEVGRKFVSEPGHHITLNFEEIRLSFKQRMDFDGDGQPEMALFQDDGASNTTGMRIVDPRTDEVVFELNAEEIAGTFGTGALRLLAITSRDNVSHMVILKQGPPHGNKASSMWSDLLSQPQSLFHDDSLFYFKINTKSIAGVFPARSISAGKMPDTEIESLSNYALMDLDGDGELETVMHDTNKGIVEVWASSDSATGVDDERIIETSLAKLLQNYPNPFIEETVISYEVDAAGPVSLVLFDELGRRVRLLVNEEQPAGRHRVTWDGRDDSHVPVASGVYFYQIKVGEEFASTKQMIRLR